MITFTEHERQWLFAMMMELYQSDYWRSVNLLVIKSSLDKLQSVSVNFTAQEIRFIQYYIQNAANIYVARSDPRAQHFIQGSSGRGSGAGAASQPAGVGVSGGGHDSYFNGGMMYHRCKEILGKLGADLLEVGS